MPAANISTNFVCCVWSANRIGTPAFVTRYVAQAVVVFFGSRGANCITNVSHS